MSVYSVLTADYSADFRFLDKQKLSFFNICHCNLDENWFLTNQLAPN